MRQLNFKHVFQLVVNLVFLFSVLMYNQSENWQAVFNIIFYITVGLASFAALILFVKDEYIIKTMSHKEYKNLDNNNPIWPRSFDVFFDCVLCFLMVLQGMPFKAVFYFLHICILAYIHTKNARLIKLFQQKQPTT